MSKQGSSKFYKGIVIYVVINVFLVICWALSGGGYFWPAWVMLGWGLSLILRYLKIKNIF